MTIKPEMVHTIPKVLSLDPDATRYRETRTHWTTIARINEYESATVEKPTLISLGENHRRTYREEARQLTAFDTLRDDNIAGVRIVAARHPDDVIIDEGKDTYDG